MWPLSRSTPLECLRVGRLAIERWVGQGAGFVRVASCPLPANATSEPECLAQALSELYAEKSKGEVSLVLESAWLPLLLVDTGHALLSAAEAEALVRHRLGAYHGDVSAWDVRVDHRAGDRFILGYGLAPGVKQALLGAADRAGLRVQALSPAFVWGWQRLRQPAQAVWWVWPEQDRALLARFDKGRLVALNPAASRADSGAAIERMVQVEAARWGLPPSDDGVTVAAWQPPTELPARSERLMWCSLVGST